MYRYVLRNKGPDPVQIESQLEERNGIPLGKINFRRICVIEKYAIMVVEALEMSEYTAMD